LEGLDEIAIVGCQLQEQVWALQGFEWVGVGGQGFCDGGDLGELAGGEPGFGVLVGAEGAVDAAGLGGGQILGTPA
jgi:hypothetical protein